MVCGEHAAKKGASAFFGGRRCLVSGKMYGDWAHLDETGSKGWFPQNLVPLEPTLNASMQRTRDADWQSIDPALRVSHLENLASSAFDAGAFRASYGLSRLACFMAIRECLSAEKRLALACYALTSLRSSPDPTFMADTIQRSILSVLRQALPGSISSTARLQIQLEMAAIYRDYGEGSESIAVFETANGGTCCLTKSSDERQLSRAFHCLGSARLLIGDKVAENILQEARKFAKNARFSFGISNADITLIESSLMNGKLHRSEGRLHSVLQYCGGLEEILMTRAPNPLKRCSWGKAIELLAVAADIEHQKGNAQAALDLAHAAITSCARTGMHLRPGSAERLVVASRGRLLTPIRYATRQKTQINELRPLIKRTLSALAIV